MKYHREIFWKPEFNTEIMEFFHRAPRTIILTNHAKNRITDRRLLSPALEQIEQGNIFEVELKEGAVHKIVSRFKMNDKRDIIVALMIDTNGYVVKSVWDCSCTDHHKTLREDGYERV
jgi:hypothetical protein